MESNELVSVARKKIDLITQILYKKYIDEYPWLTFKDLNLMISKFCKDPISDFNSAQIDVYTVREYHTKVYPLIEKINQVIFYYMVILLNILKIQFKLEITIILNKIIFMNLKQY